MNELMEGSWDARQYFVQEIVYRLHLVLDSDYKDPKIWYERLYDFYVICSCIIREKLKDEKHKEFVKRLEQIEYFLFSQTDKEGKFFTDNEKKKNKETAYKELRACMMDIHSVVWLSDVYMKRTRRLPPGKAIMDMGV